MLGSLNRTLLNFLDWRPFAILSIGTYGKEVSADAIGGTAGFERYATPCRSLGHFLILDLINLRVSLYVAYSNLETFREGRKMNRKPLETLEIPESRKLRER